MTTHILAAVALLAVVSAGGTVWLLVRDERGVSRPATARALRRLSAVSTGVVLVTIAFLHPWYWDLSIAALVAAAFLGVHAMLRALEHRASPATWGAIAVAMASVVLGSALVTLGATAAVIDGAALVGGKAVPVAHDGEVLARPELYQVFWGPEWDRPGTTAALGQGAAFQRALPASSWASAVTEAGYGVVGLDSGGCWVDPSPPTPSGPASSMSSGPFPAEIHRVFGGHAHLRPCPGFSAATPRPPSADAVVVVWVDPAVAYQLGGVSAHGAVPWPGRPDGLVAAGLSGGFASWGGPSCARRAACRALPSYATPTYALSHELVEAASNPFGHGWYADVPLRWSARYFLSHGPTSLLGAAPAFQGEVADLCEPGQPDAPRHQVSATFGARRLAVAAFYRPGTGCGS
ncbi:MAG TPA: hypothetical protein VK283_14660 [Acidimicrobiales bacterium]|nr:hypothetical protein [Acidimicrobiales bacterium]